MEYHELELAIKYLSSTGQTLSVQEVTGITAGLTRLKQNEAYTEIFLWGKCLGVEKDYYVAYGLRNKGGEFACPQKRFYWCTGDTYAFSEMPVVAPADVEVLDKIAGRLEGNPEKDLNSAGGEEEAGEGQEAAEKKLVVRESQRLAYLVSQIDADTAVVPAGSFVLDELHEVTPGMAFKGLTWDQATDESLRFYQHFRPATDVAALRVAARDDVEFHSSFLDTLDTDVPRGCWATRVDGAQSYVHLRSLLWPGYVAFHCPGTRFFGSLYIGACDKCIDLPFLL